MLFTAAAYHDIGHHIDAKRHELISAQILLEDKKNINTQFLKYMRGVYQKNLLEMANAQMMKILNEF